VVAVYIAADLVGLWGPIGDPVVYWLDRHKRQAHESVLAFDEVMHMLYTYHCTYGEFPPDSWPAPSPAENLYCHTRVFGFYERHTSESPGHKGWKVWCDGYGNPIMYRAPPVARNAPYVDLWSAGRDRQLGTADDYTNWGSPKLVRMKDMWMRAMDGALDSRADHEIETEPPSHP
jgi:hypothetical protein